MCADGEGMFLLVKSTFVLLLKNGKGGWWGSPYLDAHGEEDRDLRRGYELFLNDYKMQTLKKILLQDRIAQECVAKDSVYSPEFWMRF
jgi:E3 ubiquitin-protein ligase UBR3